MPGNRCRDGNRLSLQVPVQLLPLSPKGPRPTRRTVINRTPRARALPAVQLLTELPEGAVAPLNVNGALAFSLISQRSHPGRSHKKTRFRGLGLQQLR